MGRRHLSRLLAGIALSLAVVASAAAASTITWRVLARGAATAASTPSPYAIVATSRGAAHSIVTRVPPDAGKKALGVDYRTSVLVGVFGAFGCTDSRVRVTRIDESARTLLVRLTMRPLPPGTAECQAIFSTFRLLAVPRSGLSRVPTRASVSVVKA